MAVAYTAPVDVACLLRQKPSLAEGSFIKISNSYLPILSNQCLLTLYIYRSLPWGSTDSMCPA